MKSTLWVVLMLLFTSAFAQDKRSKGDSYFFQYAYNQAIVEYEKQKAEVEGKMVQADHLHDIYGFGWPRPRGYPGGWHEFGLVLGWMWAQVGAKFGPSWFRNQSNSIPKTIESKM